MRISTQTSLALASVAVTRILAAILLIVAGLLAGSPARADEAYAASARYDGFRDELLSFCYDDFLVVLNEAPDTAQSSSSLGAPLGDEMGDGAIARPSLPVPAPVTWRTSSAPLGYEAPATSHPLCAQPPTGPPAL